MTALAALKTGVRALLDADGRKDLGAIVEAGDLEVAGDVETWSIGGRTVTAHRLALSVDAAALLAITRDEGASEQVRRAFDRAMRTPETELADLAIVLRLPGPSGAWNHAYRDAPRVPLPESPSPDRVLAGAAALLRAQKNARAEAVVGRAELESAEVGRSGNLPLVRFVVRVTPEDLVTLTADEDLTAEIRRAVQAAGTRAAERVASIDFAVKLPGAP